MNNTFRASNLNKDAGPKYTNPFDTQYIHLTLEAASNFDTENNLDKILTKATECLKEPPTSKISSQVTLEHILYLPVLSVLNDEDFRSENQTPPYNKPHHPSLSEGISTPFQDKNKPYEKRMP